ncbi:probable prolyl 4-hydroxylase 3 [Punica granatum]|nr:probable prolyl 4-hydroxylase 3 [Punica granatum]PKI45625.1 hypothetical protein CRG98_033941 [Punica granatum]
MVLLALTVVLLVLLALGIVSLPIRNKASPPVDFSPITILRHQSSDRRSEESGQRGKQWSQVLSWEHRAVLYHNFQSKEEREHLISLAKPHVVKSTVADSRTGKIFDNEVSGPPNAKANFSDVPWCELPECGNKGLAPKMGNAVLFWTVKPDGSVDPASVQGMLSQQTNNSRDFSTKWE